MKYEKDMIAINSLLLLFRDLKGILWTTKFKLQFLYYTYVKKDDRRRQIAIRIMNRDKEILYNDDFAAKTYLSAIGMEQKYFGDWLFDKHMVLRAKNLRREYEFLKRHLTDNLRR